MILLLLFTPAYSSKTRSRCSLRCTLRNLRASERSTLTRPSLPRAPGTRTKCRVSGLHSIKEDKEEVHPGIDRWPLGAG